MPNERDKYVSVNQILSKIQKINSLLLQNSWENIDPKLVIVTKNQPTDLIKQLSDKLTNPIFGENRVNEALAKIENCDNNEIEWHFIGHLQRNKVKKILGKVALIHSLDSLSLAKEIEKRASIIRTAIDCLLQIDISRNGIKFGIDPNLNSIKKFLIDIKDFSYIKICGLMTLAPYLPPEETRVYFKRMRNLYDSLIAENSLPENTDMKILSMGMSNDFQIALQEGATMVRLGTILFN